MIGSLLEHTLHKPIPLKMLVFIPAYVLPHSAVVNATQLQISASSNTTRVIFMNNEALIKLFLTPMLFLQLLIAMFRNWYRKWKSQLECFGNKTSFIHLRVLPQQTLPVYQCLVFTPYDNVYGWGWEG